MTARDTLQRSGAGRILPFVVGSLDEQADRSRAAREVKAFPDEVMAGPVDDLAAMPAIELVGNG